MRTRLLCWGHKQDGEDAATKRLSAAYKGRPYGLADAADHTTIHPHRGAIGSGCQRAA
jgi:hypothetical protein